ncbi:MAG: hypothetical protein GF350_16660, partial [Chitinivibrionales bacterium]|nr:hypothetical protein [Chitinivibrionales bacterium]
MNIVKYLCVASMVVSLTAQYCPAQETGSGTDDSAKKADVMISGVSLIQFGKIIDAVSVWQASEQQSQVELQLNDLTDRWLSSWQLWLELNVEFSERIKFFSGMGGLVGFNVHAGPGEDNLISAKNFFFGLKKTYAQFNVGNISAPPLSIKLGYFPFKYTPAQNLGEYLFRTQMYPTLIFDGEAGATPVLGLHLKSLLFDTLQQDLLFTSETKTPPYFDFSLSYIASYNFFDAFKIGVGGSLWRMLPVKEEWTTPGLGKDNVGGNSDGIYYFEVDSVIDTT